MKKWTLSIIAFAFVLIGTAQETGMHFEHNTSWEKVLAKAKAENKHIFVDCYTTWCGPCKYMSKNIFPMAEVGDFYNSKYILVKVQLDTTKTDNEEVKSWFAAGKKIATDYNVQAYPTYLFFDPNGTIVHRAVGSSEAEKFLAKGKDALDPAKQYYTMKRQYEAGKKDEQFLFTLAKAAQEGYDRPFSQKVANDYLATQKDLLTKDNILFMSDAITSSKDKGFTELLNHPDAFDKVLGSNFSKKRIMMIINREEIMPYVSPKGKPAPASPDWNTALKKATEKYPAQAPEAVAFYKISYYQSKSDWKNFGPAVSEYMKAYGSNATPVEMNSFAWTVFENCDDMACVASALEWSKKSFDGTNTPSFIDTYANLLYKAGKKKEAIEWEAKAMSLAKEAKEDTGDYQATLEKMAKGDKTW